MFNCQEDKHEYATSFTIKSASNNFHEKKIKRQRIPRKKKSVLQEAKSMYNFHKEKNQHATSSTNKNQHVSSFMIRISFTRRKIDVQPSRK